MADITLQVASFLDGAMTVEMDISTANWRVSSAHIVNNHAERGLAVTILKSDVEVFAFSVLPGQDRSFNTNGLNLSWQDDYYNEDFDTWEAGGLDLLDYKIHAHTFLP